jgi:dihydrodipicolinate synthase/N-acetylneuraminate lyase
VREHEALNRKIELLVVQRATKAKYGRHGIFRVWYKVNNMRTSQSKKQKIALLLKQLEGVTVALATPLTASNQLDLPGLERLMDRVTRGGVSCLFPLGWAGEQPLVSNQVRLAMMTETCRLAKGRLPVMVGVSEQSLPRALEQVRMAEKAGADLILSTPPYSYIIPQSAIVDYFEELAAATPLPLVVYQNAEAGTTISEATLHEISRKPGILGVKVYMPYLEMQRSFLRSDRPGKFAVMSGDEYLYGAALFLGMRRFTMGGPGNLCPAWCRRIYTAAVAGDWDGVRRMQNRLIEFCDAVYGIEGVTAYAVVKGGLQVLDICSKRISSPHQALSQKQLARVRQIFRQYADVVAV